MTKIETSLVSEIRCGRFGMAFIPVLCEEFGTAEVKAALLGMRSQGLVRLVQGSNLAGEAAYCEMSLEGFKAGCIEGENAWYTAVELKDVE
jgi:hypothetical protein